MVWLSSCSLFIIKLTGLGCSCTQRTPFRETGQIAAKQSVSTRNNSGGNFSQSKIYSEGKGLLYQLCNLIYFTDIFSQEIGLKTIDYVDIIVVLYDYFIKTMPIV